MLYSQHNQPFSYFIRKVSTLESLIDVGQGISVGPGRFGKKNKRRALNERRAWKIEKRITVGQEKIDKLCANLCGKKNHAIKKSY